MKSGSGVLFDAQGFPVLDETDPIVAIARNTKVSFCWFRGLVGFVMYSYYHIIADGLIDLLTYL